MDGASQRRRHSGSLEELKDLVHNLEEGLHHADHASVPLIKDQCASLRRIYRILIESSTAAKDAFRHANGFFTLIQTLRRHDECHQSGSISDDAADGFLLLMQTTLEVMAEALTENSENCRHFSQDLDGWTLLRTALQQSRVLSLKDTYKDDLRGPACLFGYLLAAALRDKSYRSLFQRTQMTLVAQSDVPGLSFIRQLVQRNLNSTEILSFHEFASVLVDLWLSLPTSSTAGLQRSLVLLSLSVASVLSILCESGTRNLVALWQIRLLSRILPTLMETNDPSVKQAMMALAQPLIVLGVNNLDDARYVFQMAVHSQEGKQFLLQSLRKSRECAHFHFDLCLHGHSSIELPTLGKKFPPSSPHNGYTLTAWVRVDKFDPQCHITVFGMFDASQTCVVLVYIEGISRHLILQTSVSSSRPSVRFKSLAFEEGRWYHIGLVHQRKGLIAHSRASLFVNGRFREQVQCQFPTDPPFLRKQIDRSGPLSALNLNQSGNYTPVRAFCGTPQTLASRLGRDAASLRWSLASLHLFGDTLSDQLIALFEKVGPRYNGNFQDCLGAFLTYRASAELHLINETLRTAKERESKIDAALRFKASTLIPEGLILLSFFPKSVVRSENRQTTPDSMHSTVRLGPTLITKNYSTMIPNAAVAASNNITERPHQWAKLVGDPIVVIPQPLDEASWRVGGCVAIAVEIMQTADTKESLFDAVEILFEMLKGSWRNCEAMEKENAFAITAHTLRSKLSNGLATLASGVSTRTRYRSVVDDLELELLRLILRFVGFNEDHPEKSLVINPMAYRVLLVDCGMWRTMSPAVQQLYYGQLITFAIESHHQKFNVKRMSRMRIHKSIIDALKAENFEESGLSPLLEALQALMISNCSSDIIRSVALFIIFSLGREKQDLKSDKGGAKRNHPASAPISLLSAQDSNMYEHGSGEPDVSRKILSRHEIAVRTLEKLTDFLCRSDCFGIKRFAKNVASRWMLHLLAEPDARAVVSALRILTGYLYVQGPAYCKKFGQSSGGFLIMKSYLAKWVALPIVWYACFAVLLGRDGSLLDPALPLSRETLGRLLFLDRNTCSIVCPEVLPVICALLQSCLHPNTIEDEHQESEHVLVVTQVLLDLHDKSLEFRTVARGSNYIEQLLFAITPSLVGVGCLGAEEELETAASADSANEPIPKVVHRNVVSLKVPPLIRTATVQCLPEGLPLASEPTPRLRGSSFVLVTADQSEKPIRPAQIESMPLLAAYEKAQVFTPGSAAQGLVSCIVAECVGQIMEQKDFSGFGIFLKVPATTPGQQLILESHVMKQILSAISVRLRSHETVLFDQKVQINVARHALHTAEAVFEGWFVGGIEALLDFSGEVLEIMQKFRTRYDKRINFSPAAITSTRSVFFRTALLCLSRLVDTEIENAAFLSLKKLGYWQAILLSPEGTDKKNLRLICYILYCVIVNVRTDVRIAATDLWRMLMVQKPDKFLSLLTEGSISTQEGIAGGLRKLVEVDSETFLAWLDQHRKELDNFFLDTMSIEWDLWVAEENRKIKESLRNRLARRQDKLREWRQGHTRDEDALRHSRLDCGRWTANVYQAELMEHQRALQDQMVHQSYIESSMIKLKKMLKRPCGLLATEPRMQKWKLDGTEARSRIRLRMLADSRGLDDNYQPKRRQTEPPTFSIREHAKDRLRSKSASQALPPELAPDSTTVDQTDPGEFARCMTVSDAPEDGFEVIDDPSADQEVYEDKNRKVIKSLDHGDKIDRIYNVARILGLQAIEGLLIVGSKSLYILDRFFQRSDGEIVSVLQAPKEERDKYLQMLSGHNNQTQDTTVYNKELRTRRWSWAELIHISKRRFLFRDVAIELFFNDGRSYLLTTLTVDARDDLVATLLSRVRDPSLFPASGANEMVWRIESLKISEEKTQTFGAKLSNVFNSATSISATRKWMKGELSNFHYLMVINTMAGRTFNDLTQYPIFPWVLADYTSAELDLSNPRSFRDLTKPMGCQSPEREEAFRSRYRALAEMNDTSSPPFHYGTHYSSAMIVSSFLIRLQPFVQSYLLLQGGSFDHADRLFYSIPKAWESASRENMTDVRELIPEFFYLPEFLINANGYNLGTRQNGSFINNVALPPWAKNDPHVFIAKHREALESPYVTKHLHNWIDLIFGMKQRGEPALEATNVYHYLSYHGAKDLDQIEDPMEQLAAIGIIHNFGQTPKQIFTRPHPAYEWKRAQSTKLDSAVESLSRSPVALRKTKSRICSIVYSAQGNKALPSGAFRHYLPPTHERYMEWAFVDHSMRFFNVNDRKLVGLYEQLHQGAISTALMVGPRTMITAGEDCTVAVWSIQSGPDCVDLQSKGVLFGHRATVDILAASESFSTLMTASVDGEVILWDLNRLELIKVLASGKFIKCAQINDVTGDIMLCSQTEMLLYTLNGQLLIRQDVRHTGCDAILSCAFYEGAGFEWLERQLVFTGHPAAVHVWAKSIDDEGQWYLRLVRQLSHDHLGRGKQSDAIPGITAILPTPNAVYTGDEHGTMTEWTIPKR